MPALDMNLRTLRLRSSLLTTAQSLGMLVTFAALLLLLPAARSDAATCTGGILAPSPMPLEDLTVTGKCTVDHGEYLYKNVNIYGGGELRFRDQVIDFYAESILIENHGALVAGENKDGTIVPIGTNGGVLTIHLYGAYQGMHGVGIVCKSPLSPKGAPCGIPEAIWEDNGKSPQEMPGTHYKHKDYFYQYKPLAFDDGTDSKGQAGYFGYKVLAVSYGGRLQLFGKKGAVYPEVTAPTLLAKIKGEVGREDAGRSWGRLDGTILPGARSLKVETKVPIDWQAGDHIVVTTTDYLPSHSEELVIDKNGVSGDTIKFTAACYLNGTCSEPGVRWTHNGKKFPLSLPNRLGIHRKFAETRAAVALLTRSIRIVSEGDNYTDPFWAPNDPLHPNYYFGGQVIARQGFKQFEIDGVEFRQLGQGGRMGHYPVHFHLCRETPRGTYVMDSSINESMTRWVVIHGTEGVTLARDVGYKSIGSGFYFEDAVETNNNIYYNLGIYARAAIKSAQNPRNVPGILASPDQNHAVKYDADKDTPAVFWITNGWNKFVGNMAAGAGMCGVCYWELPASISGPSRGETWESYAGEQTATRVGTSPLEKFKGNYCTSAMTSFQTVGYTQNCPGVGPTSEAVPVTNPNAPPSYATAGNDKQTSCGPNGNPNWPICPGDYYPNIDNGQLGQATKCPDSGPCNDQTAILCQESDEKNCVPTVIDDYTTSFNYAEFNFAAVWLRRRWHLISNSFISDVQNAGLSFISGGDYTHSSAIKGLWELALKTVFVGQTQPNDKDHAYASDLSPFNSSTGLTCDNSQASQAQYCISVNNGITLGGFTGFAVAQHMFNIYDGPANEDSNAYLDITRTDLGGTPDASVYRYVNGIPRATQSVKDVAKGDCFIPNAAIGWKQPNGFYYPPTFRSRNLYFHNVDIRHYVIVPQFEPGTYITDPDQAAARYCTQNSGLFQGFSAIDRQTELTDDDGSLTGYAHSISVNQDSFFNAPIDGPECDSEKSVPEGGTARTSPYDYLTTVIYPDCAKSGRNNCDQSVWASNCSNQQCFGVPLYREYVTNNENKTQPPLPEFIRMAGMNIFQRETMSVNHGHYYIDTTASDAQQTDWGAAFKNVFQADKTYDVFLVYANDKTEQTYQMYVGPNFDPSTVHLIRVNVTNAPFVVGAGVGGDANTLKTSYDGKVLTVTLNLSAFKQQFKEASEEACQPMTFCHLNENNKCVGRTDVFHELTQEERDLTCHYAGKDVDCPKGGCVGFAVTLPDGFVADDQTLKMNLPMSGYTSCFPKNSQWNVALNPAGEHLAGKECYEAPMNKDFCP